MAGFLTRQLINAGARDAVTTMGVTGAGGAVVGGVSGGFSDNGTVIGGAFGGAALGAGAGAGIRVAGQKYLQGMMKASQAEDLATRKAAVSSAGKLNTTMFTHASEEVENDAFKYGTFMNPSQDELNAAKRAAKMNDRYSNRVDAKKAREKGSKKGDGSAPEAQGTGGNNKSWKEKWDEWKFDMSTKLASMGPRKQFSTTTPDKLKNATFQRVVPINPKPIMNSHAYIKPSFMTKNNITYGGKGADSEEFFKHLQYGLNTKYQTGQDLLNAVSRMNKGKVEGIGEDFFYSAPPRYTKDVDFKGITVRKHGTPPRDTSKDHINFPPMYI